MDDPHEVVQKIKDGYVAIAEQRRINQEIKAIDATLRSISGVRHYSKRERDRFQRLQMRRIELVNHLNALNHI